MTLRDEALADLDELYEEESDKTATVGGVEFPVFIEGRQTGVYSDQGDTLTIACRAADVPDPDVTYTVDGFSWHLQEILAGGPETGAWRLALTHGARRRI